MSDDQPKSCPFCGGVSVVVPWQQDVFNDRYYVQCQSCNVRTPSYRNAPEAIAAWNRRANGWMPSETVPQTDQDVLVWIQFPNGRGDFGLGFHDQIERRWNVYNTNQQPTHWQPLPKPPKGE